MGFLGMVTVEYGVARVDRSKELVTYRAEERKGGRKGSMDESNPGKCPTPQ